MPLTDAEILAAPLPTKGYKALTDGRRLFLRITPDGGRFWRLKYVTGGKESQASLGKYPDVSIEAARAKADTYRQQAEAGRNPVKERRQATEAAQEQQTLTFGKAAREWLDNASTAAGKRWGARTKGKHTSEVDKLKPLHGLPLREIKSGQVMAIVQAVGRQHLPTAHRVGQTAANIFSLANARYETGHNPAADRKYWLPAMETRHHAALTDPKDVAVLAGLIQGGWSGVTPTVCNALRFFLLTGARQGEICSMEWSEVDFKTSTWLAQPKEGSKLKAPHVVPLSRQAAAVLAAQKALSGTGRYVWPHATRTGRHMSTGTAKSALGSMGYTPKMHKPHGFRTTAKTLIQEHVPKDGKPSERYDSELVERQLSHKVGNAVSQAYDKSQRIDERRAMMQAWADYLDSLVAGV